MSNIEVVCDRRGSRERFDAWIRGEELPPRVPPQQIDEETQDKMLDMLAKALARAYKAEQEGVEQP